MEAHVSAADLAEDGQAATFAIGGMQFIIARDDGVLSIGIEDGAFYRAAVIALVKKGVYPQQYALVHSELTETMRQSC